MSQQPISLAEWLAWLEQADIPVLRHTARELERLRADEALLDPHNIANVVNDDPLMTVKLLRYLQTHKNRHQLQELVNVKQAIIMMGLDAFFRELPPSSIVEEGLHDHGVALLHLLATVHRARRAAAYAYDWALELHDRDAEEVYISALLTHVAEMLMWCFNPGPMLEISKRQEANKALRSADVQHQVLGFTGLDLQRRLTSQWQLPELLLKVLNPADVNAVRVRIVRLAVNLARHSADGWENAALPDDYREIAALLHIQPSGVMAMVKEKSELLGDAQHDADLSAD